MKSIDSFGSTENLQDIRDVAVDVAGNNKYNNNRLGCINVLKCVSYTQPETIIFESVFQFGSRYTVVAKKKKKT